MVAPPKRESLGMATTIDSSESCDSSLASNSSSDSSKSGPQRSFSILVLRASEEEEWLVFPSNLA